MQGALTIINEIKAYISACGGEYSDWYVGIADNPEIRLFNDHNVNRDNGYWIYRKCISSDVARKVEDYFIDILGVDGGSGGGTQTTDYVYAYKESASTRE